MKNLKKWIENEVFSTFFSSISEEKEFILSEDFKIKVNYIYPELFQTYINNEKILEIKFDLNKNIAVLNLNLSVLNALGIIRLNKEKIVMKFNNREKMYLHTAIFVSRILKAIFAPLFVL